MKSKINYYSAKRLYENGIHEKDMLVCNEIVSNYALIATNEREDCHLFDQISQVTDNEVDMKKILIVIDFSGFSEILRLKPFYKGIKIVVDNEEIIFVDYLKSNSMNKNCYLYYINRDYLKAIEDRISFGFDRVSQVPLSKWYAYSGLNLSDCEILKDVNINPDELCIIEDKKTLVKINCITAISIPVLLDLFAKYKKIIQEYLDTRYHWDQNIDNYDTESLTVKECKIGALQGIEKEVDCYADSKDFNNLDKKIKKCIDDFISLKKREIERVVDFIDEIIFQAEQELDHKTIEWNRIYVENFPVEINEFDGEGLVSLEFMEEINKARSGKKIIDEDSDEEDEDSSTEDLPNSVQIRLPFMKGVIHSCDFKQFFMEKGIKKIKGFITYQKGKRSVREYDVNKLKMIITKSQFKALTFMKHLNYSLDDYFSRIKEYNYHLGISGVEPKNKDKVRLCYQFLSTLPVKNEEWDYLIDENKVLLKQMTQESEIITNLRTSDSPSYPTGIEIYDINQEFYKATRLYKDTQSEIFNKTKNNFSFGRLYANGTRKYLCGDLLGLLYHCINYSNLNDKLIDKNSFYCPNTNLLDECIILRNPHYSRNEIVVMKNDGIVKEESRKSGKLTPKEEREKYFGHLTGVLMVNPESFAADRLGGADYDGDAVCVVSDKRLVNIVKANIMDNEYNYKYPVVKIPTVVYQPTYKTESQYELRLNSLNSTFSSRTGFISNIAFEKTLKAYQENDSTKVEEIGFYTILGGLEIDSCKNGKKPKLPSRNNYKDDFLEVKDALLGRFKNKNKKLGTNPAIRRINKNKDDNQVYYNFNKFISLNTKEDQSNFKVNKYDITYNAEFCKCKAIDITYRHFERVYTRIKDGINSGNELKEEIIKLLNYTLYKNGNDVNIEELISKFSMNAYNNYMDYFKAELPFHFIKDYNEKVEYINRFGIVLNDKELEAVTNFKNDGFKVLYLLLRYNYLNDDKGLFITDLSSLPELKLECSESIKNIINILVESYVDKIINDINECDDFNEVKESLLKHLYNEGKDLPYSVVVNTIDIINSKLTFSVFKKQVVEYLKEEA